MSGWIKIHRDISEKGWYKKSNYIHLWIHLIMKANHADSEFWFNGQSTIVKRGQLLTGRKQLSIDTGVAEGIIERILKTFENEQQIKQQTNNRNRMITILKYDLYQQNEQPNNNKRTTSGQQADTYKKNKEDKEEKDIEKRKVNFASSLKPFLSLYGKDTLNDFYLYWTEHSTNGKKLRHEKQTVFDIGRRLITWTKNETKFGSSKPDNTEVENVMKSILKYKL